jgi:uncharacterized protein YegL
MKENLTEIVTILDRSGSMEGLTHDTIGGYNNFIGEQKKLPEEANLTTVLFSSEYSILHDGIDLKKVKPITEKEYYASGGTALLDAMGNTINKIGNKLSNMKEEDRPSKVIFLIITDGEENSSREFTYEKIKDMVVRQQTIYNWQFLFFGANIDSFTTAGTLGININFTTTYSPTEKGIDSVYNAINSATALYRTTGEVNESYKEKVI